MRYLPDKRAACKINLDGQAAFAKMFSSQAVKQFKKELAGIELLEKNNINWAPVSKTLKNNNCFIVFQTWLDGKPLDLYSDVKSALKFVGGDLHSKSLIHKDLHSNNLMLCNGKIVLLDAGAVETASRETEKLDNLALFIAQTEPYEHKNLIDSIEVYEQTAAQKASKENLNYRVRAL